MTLPLTAPSDWCTDPAWHRWELQHLFPQTWQLVARLTELPPDGGALPLMTLGEPVVLTKDATGVLRALSNVCRHRAGPVCREPASIQRMVCGYHGWSYDLTGQLQHAPELPLLEIPPERRQLPAYALATWEPWLFVKRDTERGPAFREWLGELADESVGFQLGEKQFYRRMSYPIACNWKVYVENFLEPYHLPVVHPGLTRLTDYEHYAVVPRRWHSRQFGPPRNETAGESLSAIDADGAAWYWCFPNFILNCSFGLVSTNLVLPRAVDQCELICDFYIDPDMDAVAADASIHLSHEIQLEDLAICEAVQRGLASASYGTGVLHPTREVGVAHFVSLLREMGMGTAQVTGR